MAPRVSPRRCFLYLVAGASLVLLALNVRQREWMGGGTGQRVHAAPSSRIASTIPSAQLVSVAAVTSLGPTSQSLDETAERPWYMAGGTRRPQPAIRSKRTGRRLAHLFPSEEPGGDRITNQLMFVPPGYVGNTTRIKLVLAFNGLGAWGANAGRIPFTGCPVDTCSLVGSRDDASHADLILFKDHVAFPISPRPSYQRWMLYYLECPYHTQGVRHADSINWTATYRRDSDIVAPYERWQYYAKPPPKPAVPRNYAANKTRQVAWFVSNCGARNGRLQYARELQRFIQVDIFGACGTMSCARSDAQRCFELLDHTYKFYLAFENSNCRDYITEKFFVNGLGRNILPIVMGARPEDYAKVAPQRSYIHVDEFASPRELAAYLHRLDADDELYNSYFSWKGSGEFINTYFWCRVCALLHDDEAPRGSYSDINTWWRGGNICTSGSWRRTTSSADTAVEYEANEVEEAGH